MASEREENTHKIARGKMYSEMRSTSAIYSSYPCHRTQSSNEKPQPGFGEYHSEQFNAQLDSAMNSSYLNPASYQMHQNQNHGFGVQQSLMTNNGPFYNSVKNPSYSTPASYLMHQNQTHSFGAQQSSMINSLKDPICSTPASYLMHQNQNYGFSVPQSSMTNNRPIHYPGFTYHPPQKAPTYPVRQPAAAQAQEAPTYSAHQPAAAQGKKAPTYLVRDVRQPAAIQAQEAPTYLVHQSAASQALEAPTYQVRQPAAAQQVELKRNAEEEVLDVTLEVPVFQTGKPRLRWTPELHERFIRATTQLGGIFSKLPNTSLMCSSTRLHTHVQIKYCFLSYFWYLILYLRIWISYTFTL